MIKKSILSLFAICLITAGTAFATGNDNNTVQLKEKLIPMYILCNNKQTYCTIGDHTISSSGKPLQVFDYAICYNNMKTCTNGYIFVSSNKPLTVENGIICKDNKKYCAIGNTIISQPTEK